MKIAVFHNLPSGGALRMLREKVRLFKELGHAVHVYTFTTAERHLFALDGLADAVTAEPLDFGKPGRWGRYRTASRRLAAAIDASGADRVWVEKCRFAGSPWLLQELKKPAIFYLQEPLRVRAYEALAPSNEAAPYAGPKLSPVDRLWKAVKVPAYLRVKREDMKSCRSAAVVYANSRYSAHWAEKIYGVRPRVLYQAVDTSFFTPDKIGIEHYALSVGRLDDSKGHRFLLDALSRVPARVRPALYIVADAAEKAYEARLRADATEKNVSLLVHHRIPDEALKKLYCRCRLVLCAARHEPFGLVPLEAMACGAPVFAMREGGFTETVLDGRTGLLLPPDAAAWAGAVETLLDDESLQARFGEAGRVEADAKWGMKDFRRRLEQSL